MTWLRLYSDLLNKRKVQTLEPGLFRSWINLLCLANGNKPRGHLPPIEDIAFALRMSVDRARDEIKELTTAGLIDDTKDGRRPHNWDARQYATDNSTERVNRLRSRAKLKKLRAMPYAEYLASSHWSKRRKVALEKAGRKCSACKSASDGLDVHHNTYERLGEELDSDLLVLCRPCHALFHENGKLAKE